jgi:riboflavin kinase/FMN adenylyltransferase
VQFVRRIRGMAAFKGVDALVEQITDDVRRVRFALS